MKTDKEKGNEENFLAMKYLNEYEIWNVYPKTKSVKNDAFLYWNGNEKRIAILYIKYIGWIYSSLTEISILSLLSLLEIN